MAQSKTVAAAIFILAFAAVAAASVAPASASEIAGVKNHQLPGRKLLAGDGMIQITTDDLMPLSAGKAVTSGRAAGVAIQRELVDDEDWFPKDDFDKARSGVAGVQSQRQLIDMIPITTDDLLPVSAAQGLTKGRAGVVSIQKEL